MTLPVEHAVERAFWTPVIVADLPDHAEIVASLEPAILAGHAALGGRPPSQGSWQSGDIFELGGAAAARLRDHAVALADAHTRDTASDAPITWVCEGWANICGHRGYNRPHIHAGAYWTAVYYVRVDPGPGGELVLTDPRMPGIEMHASNLRFHPSGGEGAINLKPTAGTFLLFPAWMTHTIAPYFGDGYRISVALTLAVARAV